MFFPLNDTDAFIHVILRST